MLQISKETFRSGETATVTTAIFDGEIVVGLVDSATIGVVAEVVDETCAFSPFSVRRSVYRRISKGDAFFCVQPLLEREPATPSSSSRSKTRNAEGLTLT